jgi:hypothetical protein
LVILEFELRALCSQGRYSIVSHASSPLFWKWGSYFLPRPAWTAILLV